MPGDPVPTPVTGPSLNIERGLATITMRRPAMINVFGPEEISSVTTSLRHAVADPSVSTILIRGEGDRGFCAGGDIKHVRSLIVAGELHQLADFWSAEYRLNHLLSTCPKPLVTIAHGLTLGGGVGLAAHAAHRVVTDSTQMGMPEALIGLSPDAGGLWLYSRAPKRAGAFAALSAAHLSAGDALYMGLADHYVRDDQIDELVERLHRFPATEALAALQTRSSSWVADHADAIDTVCGAGSLAEMIESAEVMTAGSSESPEIHAVAQALLDGMSSGSPTALHVTHEGLRRAEVMSLEQCLEQDLRVGLHCARHPDLIEGIRARVVDKDRAPAWHPSTVADVSAADVDGYFEPITPTLQLDSW
ncbi:enoyl-CoA hydratase/isomerase family protein [Aeromicrobium sp. CF4.19]|uniref:enoyl-CoA hydratase/isomerase family protein n=1 Tax=Aeromicrobium sp. CF4.19 TaxID=3373082 RepID=UPI003EE47823